VYIICPYIVFSSFTALPLGEPWMALVIILLFCLAAATFVSHTVASLILMPVIATLGISIGMPEVTVMGSAFAGTTFFYYCFISLLRSTKRFDGR